MLEGKRFPFVERRYFKIRDESDLPEAALATIA
jgi:hypothetical protein